jgi:hypothetical protein
MSRVFGDFSRDVANKKKICYARLSSDHRKEESQVGILDRFYPGTAIIKDIGSGLNFRKKGFISFKFLLTSFRLNCHNTSPLPGLTENSRPKLSICKRPPNKNIFFQVKNVGK